MRWLPGCSALLLSLLMSTPETLGQPGTRYPESRKSDAADDYHGTRILDPYRWLEDLNSTDTKAWTDSQNALTNSVFGKIPQREPIRRRLTELWNYPRVSVPQREAGQLF